MKEFFSKIVEFFTPGKTEELVKISFPGLGIGEFNVNKIAIPIGPNGIRWYGIIITLGMVVAVLYAIWRAKQKGIKLDDMLDMALFTILFGVIGARLFYVMFDQNAHYSSFSEVIAIWDGGLAIYGGIICGTLAIVGVCLYKKINTLGMLDCIGPGVMIAQAMGRWGNFFNGEAYGSVIPEGHPLYFIRMGLHPHDKIEEVARGEMAYVHPTFLYESLWNVLGFVLINLFYKKKKFDGEVALWYFTWYGFGRMFIEALREDSLTGSSPFRVSLVIGAVSFFAGLALIIIGRIYYARKKAVAVSPSGIASDAAAEDASALNEASVEEVQEQNESTEENNEEIAENHKETENGEDY